MSDTPVVAVVGPRQAGKTTLVRQLAQQGWQYLSLDDALTLEVARRDPIGFVRDLDRAAIDEIQRAPELLPAIKLSVDRDRRAGRFLLTGSAHILTVPRIKESLAGRMEIVPLYPLSRGEVIGHVPTFLVEAFSGRMPAPVEKPLGDALLEIALAGGYPEVLTRLGERRRRDWVGAYVDAIVERDIREIADVERLGQMARLLEVLAVYAGQLVNLSEIGGQLGLNYKTADRYVTILEQLFLVRRLQPWFSSELKRLIKTPKLHFFDSGLLTVLRGQSRQRLHADRRPFGSILESFVHGELLKQASWSEDRVSLFHYRDKDQAEVDFVVESAAGEVIGIEIKAGATVGASDFRGLERLSVASGRRFRLGVVLYDGDRTLSFGGGLLAAPLSCLWS